MSDTDEMVGLMADEAQATERVEIPKDKDTDQKDVSAVEDAEYVGDDQDFSRTPWDEREHEEETEPSKTDTETDETETKTNTETSEETEETAEATAETATDETEEDDRSWMANLPVDPGTFDLDAPEFDEDGSVTNMDGRQFLDYVSKKAAYDASVATYNNAYLTRAMDAAEQVLPEIKTNPKVRQMFQNQLVAQTIEGTGDAVAAAKSIKELIGESTAQGKQSAKTHIEVQKRAAVESPSNSKKDSPDKSKEIAKRIRAGDKSAPVDLMELWLEEGKI